MNTDRKKVRRCFMNQRIFYCCPKCGTTLTFRKKMHRNLCMKCGQYLDWSDYDGIQNVYLKVDSDEEAAYWAGMYEECNGTLYAVNFDRWRIARKSYPLLLYFPFPEGKAYGRFMRKAAKEATVIKDFE